MEILIKQLRLVITNTIAKAGKVRQVIFLKFLCQMNLEENIGEKEQEKNILLNLKK